MANKIDFKIGPGIGISANSLYVVSTSDGAINSGAVIIKGGASIGRTLSLSGSLLLQNGSNYTALKSSASSNTIYTLPSQYPSIGTSVLQSDTTGQMTWVPMVASAGGGSGSGTVDYGLQYSLATYPSAGTLVTNSDVSYNPITTKLSFSNITFVGNGNSAISISGVGNGGQILTTWSTLNSGLSLDALNASLRIVGDSNAGTTLVDFGVYDNSGFPTGNWNSKYLFPKSTSAVFVNGLSITNTTASTSSSSGALTVLGGVGIGQTLFTSSSYANSLSGVVLNNSVITSGTWAGSTITTLYGGTGLSAFTKGDLLVGLGDTLYKLPAGTQGQLLQAFSSATSGLAWTSITPPTYGAFYSTQTQTVTGSGVSTPITLNSTYEAYNTQIYGGSGTSSRIQVQTSGTYNVQFSAQIHLTQGTQPKKGDFWFRINGVDVPQSNTEQTIIGKDNQTVLALNFISYFAANDYFEIIMSSDDQYFSVEALSGLTGPPRPDIPSMIVTVVPVTQIVGSSAGLGVSGIVSVNGLNQYIQYFATGRSGTDFNVSSSSQTHTFNIPHAGIGATGLITSQTQTIGGNKTFVNDLIVSSTTVSNSTTSGALVVTGGVGIGGSLNVASATAISGVTINNGFITGNLTGFATTATNINVVSANTSALHYILFSPNATGSGVALSSLSSLTINPLTNVFSIGTGTFAANGISVGASSNTITTSSGQLNLDSVSGQTNLNDNVVISGNLTVQGTTITVDSTISTFVDPVVVLGSGVGGTHSTLDNNQDRGIEFRWSNAGTATTGFFGFSDTDGKFRFIPNASLPSTNVYTGTAGTAIFGTIEATLSGNAAGTAATYTNFYGTLTGTASTSTNVHLASAGNAAGPFYITMSPSATGTGVGLSTDTSLQYNSATDVLTVTNISGTAITASTSFSGQLFGNVTGTASTATYAHQSGYGITAGVATTATNIHISSTGNAVGPFYFAMTTVSSGSGVALSTDTALQYNSATDVLSVSYLTGTAITATTSFSGPLIGNVTGTATTSTNVHLSNATTNLAHRLVFSPQSTGSGVALSSSAQVSYNPATFVLSTSGLAVTSSTNSSASNAGALIVTGGVGVGQSVSIDGRLQLFSGGNYTAFVSSASGNTVYTLPAASPATGSSVLQSTSAGVMSWVPLVASASGTTAQNIVVNSAGSADVFHQILITPSQLASGSAVSSDSLLSYNASSDRLFASGIFVTSGTASTSTFTGALLVNGGLGVSGQISFTRASLGFTGVAGTPTMAFIGATTASYISLNVLSDNSLSFEGSSGQLFTIDNNLSTGEIFSVSDISGLPIISASAGQTVILNEFGGVTKIGDGTVNTTSTTNAVLSVIGGLGVTGNAFIGGTTSITNSTVSTSTSTGALVVTGGVGIGGSLYTSSSNASSVSGIVVSNSVVRTGTWAATAITSFYGGTGHSAYTAGDLLVGAGGTLAKLAAGLSGYVLTSNGAGTVPSWQAVPPAAASSVAVTTSTLDQSFFITFVNTSSGSGLGLTTATSFVINPSSGLVTASGLALTNLSNSTSTTSGALRVSGGLGLTGNAFIGGTINAPSINQSNISNVYFTNGNITGTSVTATTIQGTLVGTATTATNIHLASTGNVAGPFYFAMSASSTGSGVALSSDTSLSYNSSTDVMTVPYVSGTAITASTSFSGQLFGNVTGTATTATNIHLASTGNVAGPFYLTMSSRSTGSGVALSSDTSLAYNSLTDVLTVSNISGAAITASTSFSGPLFGDVTGTATTATYAHQSGYGITAGIATTARNIHLASTGNVAGPFYLTMSASSAGSGIALSTDTSLSYNSATDVFTVSNISGSAITASTSFSGQLFGNVTGTATTARNSFVNAATTASDHYLIFSPNASGSGVALSSGANLVFNPSLNILSIGTGTFAANGISVGAALNTITTASGNLNLDSVSGQTNINDNVVIQGNLTVQGTTITVDSTVSTFVDPVVVLGSGVGGTHSTLDNNQDRGIEFRWSNSGTATTGFFGFTDGDGKFRFIPNASITSSNVYSGVAGTAVFGTVEATLSGNSSGTASTYTNFYGSLTGTATTSTNVHLASTGNAVGPFYLAMSSGSSGAGVALSTDTSLAYNSATDVLTVSNISGSAITASTSFSGQLFGNVTGIATTSTYSYQAGYGITAGIATTATNINVSNATTNAAHPMFFGPRATGSGVAVSSNTTLFYNPSSFILSTSGLAVTATTISTNTSSGALVVSGGVGIGGSIFVGGDVFISSATASTSADNGALRVQGGLGVSGQLSFNQAALGYTGASNPSIAFIGGTTGSPITLSVLSDNSLIFEGTSGKLFGINNNLSSGWIFNVGDISGIPLLRANADGNVAMAEFAGNVGIGLSNPAYKLHVTGSVGFTASTQSTTTSTGALIVTGGVGIGQSVSIGGRIQVFNGSNYTAFVSSATGNTVYTLPATSPATGSSVLSSTSGGVLSWVPMTSGSSSGTVNSGTATYAAFYASSTTAVSENANIQFTGSGVSVGGNINSTSTRSGSLYVSGGLGVTGNAFIGGTVNITNTTAATGVSTAALVVSGGLGVNGDVYIANAPNTRLNIMSSSGDEGGEIFLNKSVTNTTLNTGLTIDIFQNRLRFFEAGGSNRGFYLDIASGGNGVGTNIMGGASSGTVNSGTATFAAFYAGTSNAVSENANLQFTGTGLSVGGNINSTSTRSGSLYVSGGLGVTGNAFIGGTTIIQNTTAATSTNSGALVVAGGVGIGGSLYVGDAIRVGTDTYSKVFERGDILLDNGTNDSPGTKYYWQNNKNFGTDVYSPGTGITKYRIVKELGESGGQELVTIDREATLYLHNHTNTSLYAGFRFSGSGSTVYTLPSASPAIGTSYLVSNSSGVMSWIRPKRSYVLSFGAGFTPTANSADTVQINIPYAPDNVALNYIVKRVEYRNETVAGGTGLSFYIERHTGGDALWSTAHRIHAGSGASFEVGALVNQISFTTINSSAGTNGLVASGDYIRLYFTTVGSAANVSISLTIEEQ